MRLFGLGIGIFFIGYLILEIPGALLVERWSARKWFARILISWGLVSALTAFVKTPLQFYLARFFLGVAEAGFFPGIIVYFTHWFTSGDRARALSGLIIAVPFSLAIGAPVSALLLDVSWFGLAGWQWLFILEGMPAVLLGIVTLLVMTDRPRDAQWLTVAERNYLENALADEARAKEVKTRGRLWDSLRLPQVWLLALGIFAANTGGYANVALASDHTQKPLWRLGPGGSDVHFALLSADLRVLLHPGNHRIGAAIASGTALPDKQQQLFCLRGAQFPASDVWCSDDLALSDGIRRLFLALAFLGIAYPDAYRFGKRCCHWFHQYVAIFRRVSGQ